jgi:hypothetical protein
VGQVEIWLPEVGTAAVCGPFALLGKVPHSDPPGAPLPMLLGLEFLIRHHAALGLLSAPRQGEIRVA